MKQVMELISARLSAGADDYSISMDLQPLGVTPERIPSLISMTRRRLGIAAPVANYQAVTAPAVASSAGPVISGNDLYLKAGGVYRFIGWLQVVVAVIVGMVGMVMAVVGRTDGLVLLAVAAFVGRGLGIPRHRQGDQ
ncbi:MAG: hypothetical protein MZU95_15850 [Desulfomicrobium escambiense]|nr:hypothetical protein [Desulfomicrobium escambiense]